MLLFLKRTNRMQTRLTRWRMIEQFSMRFSTLFLLPTFGSLWIVAFQCLSFSVFLSNNLLCVFYVCSVSFFNGHVECRSMSSYCILSQSKSNSSCYYERLSTHQTAKSFNMLDSPLFSFSFPLLACLYWIVYYVTVLCTRNHLEDLLQHFHVSNWAHCIVQRERAVYPFGDYRLLDVDMNF